MHLVIDREDADVGVGCASADVGEDVGNGRGCAVRGFDGLTGRRARGGDVVVRRTSTVIGRSVNWIHVENIALLIEFCRTDDRML
jgi:hypothetical protein